MSRSQKKKLFACCGDENRNSFWNNLNCFKLQVYSADLKYHKTIEGRTSSISTMRLHLQSSHFGGGNPLNGQLILRCTAQIGNFYNEYTEKELSIPQKDPIPARGKRRFDDDVGGEKFQGIN